MSIYPVLLSEWFQPGDEYNSYDTAKEIVSSMRCLACRSRPRWKRAVAHHSLPWGNGDLWCSWKCCESGKVAKPDKRRERRLARKYGKIDQIHNLMDKYFKKGHSTICSNGFGPIEE